jgi:hypothetical protein
MNGDWRPTQPRYERERGGEHREPTGQYREPTGLAWLEQQHIQQQQQQVACSRSRACSSRQPLLRGVCPAGSLTSCREKPQQRQQQQQHHSDPVRGSGDRDAQARRTYYGDVSATTQCARTQATPFSRPSSAHLGFSAWQSHVLREW